MGFSLRKFGNTKAIRKPFAFIGKDKQFALCAHLCCRVYAIQ